MNEKPTIRVILNIFGTDGYIRQEIRVIGQTITPQEYLEVVDAESNQIFGIEVLGEPKPIIHLITKPVWNKIMNIQS